MRKNEHTPTSSQLTNTWNKLSAISRFNMLNANSDRYR
jgi:hypothetical protein